MRVVVIGNGECALNRCNGTFIDKCDRIIRVNKFTLFGYEKYVGSRVDIYCAKWHKIVYRIHDHNEFWFPHPKPPTMWHALGGKKEITEQDHQSNVKALKLYKPDMKFLSAKSRKILDKNFKKGEPSVGIIAIQMAMDNFDGPIYTTGFDFMTSGWYWDPSHDCTADFRNCTLEEMSYYKKLESRGHIIDITKS
tara:strand:+ start:102 stop:683 length:582 start_codon:yes stop_codon:yes gene_type:complete